MNIMLKKVSFFAILATIISLSVPSCYYDNEQELYGTTTCDTTAVSYANDIVPILENNCYGCHDNGNFSISNAQFDNYNLLKTYATGGGLIGRINDVSSPMPPAQLMDECNRNIIKAWVEAGAPNN
jgi:hypothetical protein